jgi:hypothetical protein
MKSAQSNRGYELSVGEARRLSHSASYLLSPNSSNHYSLTPYCLKLSKSISSEDWDTWPAFKRYTHFGGGSIPFAQKYWHSVWAHKGPTPSCSTNENRTVIFQFKDHGIDKNSHGENLKWDEVHRTPITFAVNSRRNCAQIPKSNTSASRNRLSHEVLKTWAAVYGSSWSQEPRRSLYFAPW